MLKCSINIHTKLSSHRVKKLDNSLKSMDWLHDLLTILAIFLLIMVSISSISPRCDYWVKMFILYMWYLFTSVLVIPIGLITRNPIISKYFLAFLYFLIHNCIRTANFQKKLSPGAKFGKSLLKGFSLDIFKPFLYISVY